MTALNTQAMTLLSKAVTRRFLEKLRLVLAGVILKLKVKVYAKITLFPLIIMENNYWT